MRLIMMGTGPFAVPTFESLYDSPHQVLALVTQPPRAARGRPAPASPLRRVAETRGTPIVCFENINTNEAHEALRDYRPDLFVVADYGQILSPATLAVAKQGGINLHGSLLPKYRGAAPINWAIYHGERETGVTTIHMTPQVDAGPCLLQASTLIGPDENAIELEHRLAELGAPLVIKTIEMIESARIEPIVQDASRASRAPRVRKTDGEVNWFRPAAAIRNQVRAMVPWPKTYTFWHRGTAEPLRLILERVREIETGNNAAAPGTVLKAEGKELTVATGGGHLAIDRIQPAGKRELESGEFLRGYPVKPGDHFGPEPRN